MAITRAISIRQPFVELILQGKKKAEYRSVPTRIRERVYLYASKNPADLPKAWKRVGKGPGELPTGVIAGSVEIVDCRWDAAGRCFAYVFSKPVRFRTPRRAKNAPQPLWWKPQF